MSRELKERDSDRSEKGRAIDEVPVIKANDDRMSKRI